MSLLIKNVNLKAAGEDLPERGDVFLSGSQISAIGNFSNAKAGTVVDGQGLYCAPGFIDIHAESDHHPGFFEHPLQTELLSQGVTSAFLGQDGVSLAPWTRRGAENFLEISGSFPANIGWRTFGEFMQYLRSKEWGINLGTFVGYSTLRRSLEVDDLKPLRPRDSKRLAALLEEALAAGAWGLSAGFRNFLEPALFHSEMKALAPVIRRYDAILSLSMLSLDKVDAKTLTELKRLDLPKIVFTDVPLSGGREFQKFTDFLENAPADWLFETSALEGVPVPIHSFLPSWLKRSGLEEAADSLRDEWLSRRVMKELPPVNADETWVIRSAHHPELAGMNLSQIGESLGLDGRQTLFRLMRESSLRTLLVEKNAPGELVRAAVTHPRSLIGSRGFSISERHKHGLREPVHNTRAFPEYIRLAGVSQESVGKATSKPAELLGLTKKGRIREGFAADLVLFSANGEVEVKHVVIGGDIVWSDGCATDKLRGKVVMHRNAHGRARD